MIHRTISQKVASLLEEYFPRIARATPRLLEFGCLSAFLSLLLKADRSLASFLPVVKFLAFSNKSHLQNLQGA